MAVQVPILRGSLHEFPTTAVVSLIQNNMRELRTVKFRYLTPIVYDQL